MEDTCHKRGGRPKRDEMEADDDDEEEDDATDDDDAARAARGRARTLEVDGHLYDDSLLERPPAAATLFLTTSANASSGELT